MGYLTMVVNKELHTEIKKYCELNEIVDIDKFIEDILKQGFHIEKYGMGPIKPKEVTTEIEKIVEVIKEVPVEVIKEVIKEVPVDKIVEVEKIVEKIVTKEVYITDDEEVKKLGEDVEVLRKEVATQVKIVFEVSRERDDLRTEVEKYKKHTLDNNQSSETVKHLEQTIKNLKVELELEQNRNIKRKTNDKPKHSDKKSGRKNIISWVSRDERDSEENSDIWGE